MITLRLYRTSRGKTKLTGISSVVRSNAGVMNMKNTWIYRPWDGEKRMQKGVSMYDERTIM